MIVYQGNLGDDVSCRFFILLLLLQPCSIHSLFRLFFDDTFSVLTTQISCLNQFLFVFCFIFVVLFLVLCIWNAPVTITLSLIPKIGMPTLVALIAEGLIGWGCW